MPRTVEESVFSRMMEIRRDLHRHPELSRQESRTAELGIEARALAGTGR